MKWEERKSFCLTSISFFFAQSLEGSYVHAALEALKKRKIEVEARMEAKDEVADMMEALDVQGKESGEEEIPAAQASPAKVQCEKILCNLYEY